MCVFSSFEEKILRFSEIELSAWENTAGSKWCTRQRNPVSFLSAHILSWLPLSLSQLAQFVLASKVTQWLSLGSPGNGWIENHWKDTNLPFKNYFYHSSTKELCFKRRDAMWNVHEREPSRTEYQNIAGITPWVTGKKDAAPLNHWKLTEGNAVNGEIAD